MQEECDVQGGLSCNTPRSNASEAWYRGGEDTAVIGMGVKWSEEFADFRDELERLKEIAGNKKDAVRGERAGYVFVVEPRGYRAGLFYSHVVTVDGMKFGIGRRDQAQRPNGNVRVEISSTCLMLNGGLDVVWAEVLKLVGDWGGEVEWSAVSRVDMCVDLPNVETQELQDPFAGRWYTCRSNDNEAYHRGERRTGFSIGRGDVRLRVYDKLLECSEDLYKYEIVKETRWGGEVPNAATRVEFQLRRGFLKEFQIDTVEDYLKGRRSVSRYLTREWFRMTLGADKRSDRRKVLPLWERIAVSFEEWSGGEGEVLRRTRRLQPDFASLVRQGFGCFASAYAIYGQGEMPDRDDFFGFVFDEVYRLASRIDVADVVGQKLLEYSDKCPDFDFRARLMRQQYLTDTREGWSVE